MQLLLTVLAVAVLCCSLQAEARLSTQRAAVEEAEAAVQEALRRLREAEVRGPRHQHGMS